MGKCKLTCQTVKRNVVSAVRNKTVAITGVI